MPKFGKKKLIVGAVSAALIAGGAGAAYAYWTSTGSGTGTATTGDAGAWQVTIASTDLKDLSPGGPTETVNFTIKNTGSGQQNLASAVASVVDTSASGCTASDFAVGVPTITYGDKAAGSITSGTFTLQMIDSGSNQDACKNATVNLKVDAS